MVISMVNSISSQLSFQLPLFNFHKIRPSFFTDEESEFCRYLSTLESLLLPKEKKILFSEPWTGRKGYSSFQVLSVLLLKMFRRYNTIKDFFTDELFALKKPVIQKLKNSKILKQKRSKFRLNTIEDYRKKR